MKPSTAKKLSEEFLHLAQLCEQPNLTYAEFTNALTSRGHAITSLILAFPFLIPVPLPGLSQILGLIIIISGIRLAADMKPWIPKRFLQKPIPAPLITKLLRTSARVMTKIEGFIKPRGAFLSANPWLRRVNGGFIALSGFFLALPLPPGTNFPPALTIVFLSIAILEEDGVFLLLGYLLLTLMFAGSFLIAVFGIEGLKALI